MRIESLQLLRFGKFTDRLLELPAAERDFHLVVGANEAGKSTLRAAISDLLYGIPVRTTHDFLHAKPDLRLGACLEHQGARLAFHRTKAARQTLRDAAGGAALPDTALEPFLGAADRTFFDQMFGLDHDRLVAGGHSILSAADDVGRILFESASGVAGLGDVRESLEKEAAALWAPRKSGERAYYQALDAFDEAGRRLKEVTVRTRDWTQLDEQRREAQAEFERCRARLAAIRTERNRLERVRRVGHWLSALGEHEQALASVADAAELPADAMHTLIDVQQTVDQARVRLTERRAAAEQAQARLAALARDEAVLAHEIAIDGLADLRRRFASHAGDIEKRLAEVDSAWRDAVEAARRLGWQVEGEAVLRQRLPGPAARRRLQTLAASHPAQRQRIDDAQRTHAGRLADLEATQSQLQALGPPDEALPLRDALAHALGLGDVTSSLRMLEREREQAQAALADARRALGRFDREPAQLRAMSLPPARTIDGLLRDRARDEADLDAAQREQGRLAVVVRQAEEALAHIRSRHRPVDRGQVIDARRERDTVWQGLRADPATLAARADVYVRHVDEADRLADARHETAERAGELARIETDLVRQRVELGQRDDDLRRLAGDRAARDAQWQALAAGMGLAGLALDDWPAWVEARRDALAADDRLRAVAQQHAATRESVDAAAQALSSALAAAAVPVGADAPMSQRILAAQTRVRDLDTARGRREALAQQLDDGRRALASEAAMLEKAQEQLQAWQNDWAAALQAAGLASDSDVDTVRAALDLFDDIDHAFERMHTLREERIKPMRADLAGFEDRASVLAAALDPELVGQSADAVAQQLEARLVVARDVRAEAVRLARQRDDASDAIARSQADVEAARARLEPLRRIAGVAADDDESALRAAIERSDSRRALLGAVADARMHLQQGGDGLTREALQAEADAVDRTTLAVRVTELQAEEAELGQQQAALAARRQQAEDALARIAGRDDAAQANAARNEAVARMAEAVERYLKVNTAARLLRWSIERFQDEKQAPLLKRASAIFSDLTLGAFARLDVDRDAVPPRLQGRRADQALVDVEGMSEGTRDQLFLALRLAALDLHLSQAHALPFVADDLFVNFDDGRSKAGLSALGELSRRTQVVFLTHHAHLVPVARDVFGDGLNVIRL